jgi:hypothetical protein
MAVQPGTPRWQELVQQGIIRDGQRNWFLGDAALEIAPMGGEEYHNGSEAHLRQYADEIGVEYHSIVEYRRVAAAWPSNNRVLDTSWKVHAQLTSRKELIRPGMTVTQAAAVLGQKNNGRTGPRGPLEDRVEAAKNFLSDPEVANEVFADPVVSQRASDIIARQSRPVAQAQDRGEQREQREGAAHGNLRYLQAAQYALVAKKACLDMVTCLRNVPDEDEGLAVVRDAQESHKEASRLVDARLSSASGTDWDAELERLS